MIAKCLLNSVVPHWLLALAHSPSHRALTRLRAAEAASAPPWAGCALGLDRCSLSEAKEAADFPNQDSHQRWGQSYDLLVNDPRMTLGHRENTRWWPW